MLKQNSELRAQAREALRGKWPMAAVAALCPNIRYCSRIFLYVHCCFAKIQRS